MADGTYAKNLKGKIKEIKYKILIFLNNQSGINEPENKVLKSSNNLFKIPISKT